MSLFLQQGKFPPVNLFRINTFCQTKQKIQIRATVVSPSSVATDDNRFVQSVRASSNAKWRRFFSTKRCYRLVNFTIGDREFDVICEYIIALRIGSSISRFRFGCQLVGSRFRLKVRCDGDRPLSLDSANPSLLQLRFP